MGKLLEIRNLISSRPAANPIETTIHSGYLRRGSALIQCSSAKCPDESENGSMSKCRAAGSINIRSIGGNEANIISRWHVVVRNYNLLDLYNWGIKPEEGLSLIDPRLSDADRTRIITAANLQELEAVGRLPTHADPLDPSIEAQAKWCQGDRATDPSPGG